MAIYVQDKILKADPKGTKLEREYAAGLDKVNTLFEKFRIEGNKSSYLQLSRVAKKRVMSLTSKRVKRLPTIALPVEVSYYDDEIGATTIRYSTTPPSRNNNGQLNWGTKYIEFREYLTINEKQKDLAWFLLFASNLTEKGVYKLVDIQGQYEGTFSDMVTKKNVLTYLVPDEGTDIDEDLVRHLTQKYIGEGFTKGHPVELAVKLGDMFEQTKIWKNAYDSILAFNSGRVLQKERLSAVEYEEEPVTLMTCPASVNYNDLKAEARELSIKLTSPPQSKDMLYSLIQHVKAKVET